MPFPSLGMVFRPKTLKNTMKDMAVFIGVFMMGYLLTMGLLYVALSVFPRRKDRRIDGLMNVSGNLKHGNAAMKGIEKSAKMKLANG